MGTVDVVRDAHGMEKALLVDASGSRAEVYLHGAHVTSWRASDGAERLFLSRAARFESGSAIRGGIPVIFPQFADRGPFARHGFARLAPWRFVGPEEGSTAAVFTLDSSPETRARWPFEFRAELTVALAERSLDVRLAVVNRDEAPFDFTAALHSYLRVPDVSRATVAGLAGLPYESRVEGVARAVERAPEVHVGGELDRVYFGVTGPLVVRDGVSGGGVELRGDGFPDVVLWNPGAEKARALSDLGAGEYRELLCVEAAAVERPVRLAPGARWRGRQRLSVLPAAPASPTGARSAPR